MPKKVFVSGCYDLLHSGHVEFFRQAAQYGDLYVGIGSDATILGYKHHKTVYSEQERLFMVKSIRYVKDAFINEGSGIMDFVPTVERIKPDILVVNEDGGNDDKKNFCKEHGIEYIVLQRVPHVVEIPGQAQNEGKGAQNEGKGARNEVEGALPARSSTDLKKTQSQIPTRLDLAGTWIDQPYVSCYAPGWAITISLEPTFEIRERCGLSTSTRNMIKKIWPYQLPNMDPEMLAKLVFCFENDPERSDGIISGAQDSIGICVPGLCRHWYNGRFWPEKIETCYDDKILCWLENHICLIPLSPRKPGFSVIEGKDITEPKVRDLAAAADACWNAILAMDLDGFAKAYRDSFQAQVAMFPAMIQPEVKESIDMYKNKPGVMAWKMPGAGGGGYLALVCRGREYFPEGAIELTIHRPGM